MTAPPPPSKKDQLLKLLERGSVFLHLDPRREGVSVPAWLVRKPPLVLQLGLNFPIPIRDLEIDDNGVRCTLSFNRSPFYCILPWTAIYALVGEDGTVTVWPSELPADVVQQTQSGAVRRDGPKERRGRKDKDGARDEGAKPAPRPSLSLVPPPPPSSEDASTSATTESVEATSDDTHSSANATDTAPRSGSDAVGGLDARERDAGVDRLPSEPEGTAEKSPPRSKPRPSFRPSPVPAAARTPVDGDTRTSPEAAPAARSDDDTHDEPEPPTSGPGRSRERPPYLRLVK